MAHRNQFIKAASHIGKNLSKAFDVIVRQPSLKISGLAKLLKIIENNPDLQNTPFFKNCKDWAMGGAFIGLFSGIFLAAENEDAAVEFLKQYIENPKTCTTLFNLTAIGLPHFGLWRAGLEIGLPIEKKKFAQQISKEQSPPS